jgi:hypothetical protein
MEKKKSFQEVVWSLQLNEWFWELGKMTSFWRLGGIK